MRSAQTGFRSRRWVHTKLNPVTSTADPTTGKRDIRTFKLPLLVLRHRQTWDRPLAELAFPPLFEGRLAPADSLEYLWRRLKHALFGEAPGGIPSRLSRRPEILDTLAGQGAWHLLYRQRLTDDGPWEYRVGTVAPSGAAVTSLWPTRQGAQRAFKRAWRGR